MMTRDKANEIARDMLAALQDVAKKHGIQIKDKGGRFDPNGGNATFKFEAAFLNAQGTAETRERTAFTRQAKFFNLKPEWLDMEFAFAGDDYKIVGLNTKAYKAPVLAIQSSNGIVHLTLNEIEIIMDNWNQMQEMRREGVEA